MTCSSFANRASVTVSGLSTALRFVPCRTDVVCALTAALVAVGGFIAGPAGANDGLRPGIIRDDDRQPVRGDHQSWNAIGHVNVSGYNNKSACTGTMVAPGVVLTAAHCVIDPWSKKLFRPGRINFRAGVTRGKHVGHSVAKCVKLHDELARRGAKIVLPNLPDRRMQIDNVQFDLAIIVLEDEIKGASPLPVADTVVAPANLRVTHASYTADRRFTLMAHKDCRVKSRAKNLWVTDCDTHAAGSGGPIIVETADGNRLAAVMAGVVAKKATVAVPVDNWRNLPLDRSCPAQN